MKLKSYLMSLLVMFACSLLATSCEEDPIEEFGGVNVGGHTVAFDLRVGGATAHGMNVQVLPSNNESTYYFGIIESEKVKDLQGDALVQFLLEMNAGEYLISGEHYVKSEQMEIENPLKASTSYFIYALGYDEATKTVTSELTNKSLRTKKDQTPGPDVPTITAPVVDFMGLADQGKLAFAARCTSMDATYAAIGLFNEGAKDEIFGQGVTFETIFNEIEGAQEFSAEWLGIMNTEQGIILTAAEDDGKTVLEGFLKVTNDEGGIAVLWTNTKGAQDGWNNSQDAPAPQPEGVTAPEVDFVGVKEGGVLGFAAKCFSQDASAARIALFEGGIYDQMKADGITLETVFSIISDGIQDFSADWIAKMNSEQGLGLQAAEDDGKLVLEGFLEVKNDEGGMAVLFASTEGAKDSWNNEGQAGGNTPSGQGPECDFQAGVNEKGVAYFAMICMSQDCEKAYILLADKASVDGIVGQGASLAEIMDGNLKQATQFNAEWLGMFNSADGLSLENDGLDVKQSWTGILDARNANGRTVLRADTPVTKAMRYAMTPMASFRFAAKHVVAYQATL